MVVDLIGYVFAVMFFIYVIVIVVLKKLFQSLTLFDVISKPTPTTKKKELFHIGMPDYCLKQCSEYDTLITVVMCSPANFEMDPNGPAHQQHRALVSIIQRLGPRVELLGPQEHTLELGAQVYTRDIGVVIGDMLFEGQMNSNRARERPFFERWLQKRNLRRIILSEHLEGGDVIVDGNNVWVGQSSRTSSAAIKELQIHLGSHYTVYALPFSHKYLHLDCIFNILSPKDAIIFPQAFTINELALLNHHYGPMIEVDDIEQKTLATNVLSIGNRHVIGSLRNPRAILKIKQRGYNFYPVLVDEFVASNGAVRCLTLPLCRSKKFIA